MIDPESKYLNTLWRIAGLVVAAIVGVACLRSLSGPLNVDFTMFWGGRPLAYPPPYLLFIRPLAYLPYGYAFVLWVALTGFFYFWASREARLASPANPAAAFNGMIGQNGFLTAGIMFIGLRVLALRPAIGGAILGLLSIKPHLAMILPFAVVGARAYRAIPAAMGTIAVLVGLSLTIFGSAAYGNFLQVSLQYGQYIREGAWDWNEIASLYALCRWLGFSASFAWGLHAIVATLTGFLVWLAWRQDWEGKIPLTSAAALLISPYLFTYDGVLLTLALAWLSGWKALGVWLLLAVPLVRVFTVHDLPNTVPLAAGMAVGVIALAGRRGILRECQAASATSAQ